MHQIAVQAEWTSRFITFGVILYVKLIHNKLFDSLLILQTQYCTGKKLKTLTVYHKVKDN